MGRSVSRHPDAVATVFLNMDFVEENEDGSDFEFRWQDFKDDLTSILCERYPSFSRCSPERWVGNEDLIIVDNQRAEVSISNYGSLVSICLAPLHTDEALDVGWCDQVANGFVKYLHKVFANCALVHNGTMSNGESVYRRVQQKEQSNAKMQS